MDLDGGRWTTVLGDGPDGISDGWCQVVGDVDGIAGSWYHLVLVSKEGGIPGG